MSIDGFRQGMRDASSQPRSNKSGGRKASWRNRADLPKEHENPEPFVFFDAEYKDVYAMDPATKQPLQPPPERTFNHSKAHKCMFGPKGSKNPQDYDDFACSSGPNPLQQQPCIGCYYADRGVKSISPAKDIYDFNVGHIMPYHKTPLVSRQTGQAIMKDDNTGPIIVDEPCALQGCTYCQQNAQYQAAGHQPPHPVVLGAHKYLEVGFGHLGNIQALDEMVRSVCATCLKRTGGNVNASHIKATGYACPHCKALMLDIATSGMDNKQLKHFAENVWQCRNCNQAGQPTEVGVCGYDPTGLHRLGGCPQGQEPQRLSILDCVFYLKKTGQNQQSKITCTSWIPIADFMLEGGRPLSDVLKELYKKPFDFAAMRAAEPLPEQAKKARQPIPMEYQQYVGVAQQGMQPGLPQPGVNPYAPQPSFVPPQPQQPYGAVAQPQQPIGVAYPNLPQPGRPNH